MQECFPIVPRVGDQPAFLEIQYSPFRLVIEHQDTTALVQIERPLSYLR
jgi:hypothetical protein